MYGTFLMFDWKPKLKVTGPLTKQTSLTVNSGNLFFYYQTDTEGSVGYLLKHSRYIAAGSPEENPCPWDFSNEDQGVPVCFHPGMHKDFFFHLRKTRQVQICFVCSCHSPSLPIKFCVMLHQGRLLIVVVAISKHKCDGKGVECNNH